MQTFGSTRGSTAQMTIAERQASGMYLKLSVSASIATMTMSEERTPLMRVRAPLDALTAVREKLPVTGYDKKMEPIKFAAPRVKISCELLIS